MRYAEPILYLAGCYVFSYKALFGLIYFSGLVLIYHFFLPLSSTLNKKSKRVLMIALSLLLVYEWVNYFMAINRINAFLFIEFIAFFLLAFFLYTKWQYPEFSLRIVILAFGILGAYHCWDTIHHLIRFIDPDPVARIPLLLYSRDIYIPQGMNQGWVTTLVSFLPFILLLYPFAKRPFQFGVLLIVLCAAVFSIIICLGRAGILAMTFVLIAFLLLVFLTRYYPPKIILGFSILGVAILAVALFPFKEPVLTTFKMAETEIQRSSAASRTEVLKAAWDHLPNIPVGVGSLNFSLYYQTTPEISRDRPYLLHANSIVSEWLIEKGWIGSLIYFLFFMFLGISFLRRFRRIQNRQSQLLMGIAFIGLTGMLIRDVFFATIPRDEAVFVNFVTLVGIIIISGWKNELEPETGAVMSRNWNSWIIILPAAFIGWTVIHGSLTYIGRKFNYQAILSLEEKNYEDAIHHLNRAKKFIPGDGRLFLHLAYIQVVQSIEEPDSVPEKYHTHMVKSPERLKEAVKNLEKCIRFSPRDDAYYHVLAWLQFLTGNPAGAESSCQTAISTYPHQAEYHITHSIMLDALGRPTQAKEALKLALFIDPGICLSVFWKQMDQQYSSYIDRRSVLKEVLDMPDWDETEASDIAKLGALHYLLGDFNSAGELLTSALELQPNFTRPYLYLSLIELCEGDRTRAIELLSKSVSLNRGDYIVLLTLADLIHEEEPQRSEELVRSATYYYHDLKTAHTDRRRSRYKDRAPWIRNDYMPPNILYYYAPEFRSRTGDCLNE